MRWKLPWERLLGNIGRRCRCRINSWSWPRNRLQPLQATNPCIAYSRNFYITYAVVRARDRRISKKFELGAYSLLSRPTNRPVRERVSWAPWWLLETIKQIIGDEAINQLRREGKNGNWKVPPAFRLQSSQERFASQVLLSTPTWKRPRGHPWTRWRDCISDLAWSPLGVEPPELSQIAVDREIFRVLQGCCPRDSP